MTEINKAGSTNSLGHIDTAQGEFRSQIDALTDAVRQLGGNPRIAPGGTNTNDPLNAPYVLYVNSYTGSDKFVTGDYASADDGTFAAKMRRISNQRLECGYTVSRPFKSLTRAVIEAAIISSRDYLTLGKTCGDNITIVVSSGIHEACNGPGIAANAANFPAWSDGEEPTTAQLQSFNPLSGGLVLPRSVSIISADLRKTRISPCYVPSPDDERADLGNRSAIFRMTGGCYFYGFSFVDKIKSTESHHLLSCFEFASTAQLDEFYEKIRLSFSGVAGINDAFAVTRNYENRIVGPAPEPGLQTETTDTTEGSSPYIYNCSIRSNYGLCGVLLNGDAATGFKSTVIAQFTGVSLQRDMSCWQVYKGKQWINYSQAEYSDYIDETPDNVRMDPNRRSFHIRAINRAIIQEVSVFAIGQGVHHWVQSAGELTVTNSNSNFGGVSALAEGFVSKSFLTDTNWNVSRIVVPADIATLTGNVNSTSLGACASSQDDSSKTITLEEPLSGELINQPTVLDSNGYSLNNYGGDSYIWLENTGGPDYRARLSDTAWDPANPNQIKVKEKFLNVDGLGPISSGADPTRPPLAGLRVYVRRLTDTRSLDQRSVTFRVSNTATDSRNIVRDYGLQVDTVDPAIDSEIDSDSPIVVARPPGTGNTLGGTARENRIELRRSTPPQAWDKHGLHPYDETAANSGNWYRKTNPYYRQGDTVRFNNKHWLCTKSHFAVDWDPTLWEENFVHMQSDFGAEDYFQNDKPIIVFDRDLDPTGENRYLGYDPSACFVDDVQVRSQLRTGTDYLGAFSFLKSLGFNENNCHKILAPAGVNDREHDPNRAFAGIPNPTGAANSWSNWAIQFRRPSQVRLFGMAFEWTGQLNYTKALPQYQRDLSPANKFSYFFTNEGGGRCYVSGFNEEGLQVTAAGLTDLQSGETLAAGDIGGDRDSNVDVFADVLVTGTLEANNIKSNQVSLVKWLNDGQTDPGLFDKIADPAPVSNGKGFGWIASTEHIANMTDRVNGKPKFWDADWTNQNGYGKTGANFVTPYYLDTWRSENRLVSSRSEPLRIFVNPKAGPIMSDSGNPNFQDNESRNWNATTVADLAGKPPEQPANAVPTLSLAVAYANATVSPLTPVYYFIGPGFYDNTADRAFVFEHPVQIQAWSFKDAEPLSDGKAGGSAPFMGTVNSGQGNSGGARLGQVPEDGIEDLFSDPDKAPLFPTRLRITTEPGNQQFIRLEPPTFTFKKDSYVTGIVWLGVNETLRNAQGEQDASFSVIKNRWFQGVSDNGLEYIRGEDNSSIFNAWVSVYFSSNPGFNSIYWMRCRPVIEAYREIKVNNVGIGAQSPSWARGGIAEDESLFRGRENAVFRLAGLFLVGNVIFDKSVAHSDNGTYPMPTVFGKDDYKLSGFCNTFIAMARESVNNDVTIGLGGWNSHAVGSQRNWNLTYNNWHLITNKYKYVSKDDIYQSLGDKGTEDYSLNGPGIINFFGSRSLNRTILSAQVHWHNHRGNSTTHRQGLQGWFGRFSLYVDGVYSHVFDFGAISSVNSTTRTAGQNSIGGSSALAGTKWRFVDRWYVLQQAGIARVGQPSPKEWDQKQWATPGGGYVNYGVALQCVIQDPRETNVVPSNLVSTVLDVGFDPKSALQSNARAYG